MIIMDTSYFILFRNFNYAKTIEKALNGKICISKSKLFGITPEENDIFLVDAHFGDQMSNLEGLDILREFLFTNQGIRFNAKIYSWFTAEYIFQNYPNKSSILQLPNVQYMRFPVIISQIS